MPRQIEITRTMLGRHTVSYGCPHCDSDLKSPVGDIGKPDRCPDCNREFLVPGAEEWAQHLAARQSAADQRMAEREARRQVRQLERERVQRQREIDRHDAVQPAPPRALHPGETPVVAKVFWVLCILWVGFHVFGYLATSAQSNPNAIQQAALAASTCVWIISAYVVCRAVDQLSR